jgi:hypothetical protein
MPKLEWLGVQGLKKEWLLWFLGAALFSNLVAFFGVNYFDQVKMIWFVLLAMISAITASITKARKLNIPAIRAQSHDSHQAAAVAEVNSEEPVLRMRHHSQTFNLGT